jgi:hypothetical protein
MVDATSSLRAGTSTAGAESVGVHAADARLIFSGNASANNGGAPASAQGIWLENAPGSELNGTVSATSGSTAIAVEMQGDASGSKVESADVSATGLASTGVLLSNCAGTVPLISDNPSIKATTQATGTARAILATACDADIEDNTEISGIGAGNCTLEAIRCNEQSRCVIRDNPDIHNELQTLPGKQTVVGIACEAGSCAQISGNGINAVQELCRRTCTITSTGIDLTSTDTLVEGNTVRGGCGDDVVGLQLNFATAEVRNNSIAGRATDVCSDTQDNVVSSFGIADSGDASDVDSNTIDAGGTDNPLSGPCGSAAVKGGSLYRNNTLLPGTCYYNASIDGFPTGTFQNNGLGGVVSSNFFIHPGLFNDPPMPVDLATVNTTGASSGNYTIP